MAQHAQKYRMARLKSVQNCSVLQNRPLSKSKQATRGQNRPVPNGGEIEIVARLTDEAAVDDLIRSINALKLLLQPVTGVKKPNDEAAY